MACGDKKSHEEVSSSLPNIESPPCQPWQLFRGWLNQTGLSLFRAWVLGVLLPSVRKQSTHQARTLIGCFERFFAESRGAPVDARGCPPRLSSTAHLCIGVYCHKELAVEELFFAPAVIHFN